MTPLVILILIICGAIAVRLLLRHLSKRNQQKRRDAVLSEVRGLMREYHNRRDEWIIVDTETTGLAETDVVIEIGVLSGHGEVLMDSRVRLPPRKRISAKAQEIHGITRDDLKDASEWAAIRAQLDAFAAGKECVAYNASFDSKLILQTDEKHGVNGSKLSWVDIMPIYNTFVGEWDSRRNKIKWQKLPGGDHSAIGDAKAVFSVLNQMGLAE